MAQTVEQLREIPLRLRVDSSQICEMVDGVKELIEAARKVVEVYDTDGDFDFDSQPVEELRAALVKIDDADAPDPQQQTLDLNP